jgi:hypothetical protein
MMTENFETAADLQIGQIRLLKVRFERAEKNHVPKKQAPSAPSG